MTNQNQAKLTQFIIHNERWLHKIFGLIAALCALIVIIYWQNELLAFFFVVLTIFGFEGPIPRKTKRFLDAYVKNKTNPQHKEN